MSDILKPFQIEVCANSVESAIQAELGGANRIELCDNLVEGGTTPSIGMIESARKNLNIPVNVIIRPRGGDFCFSDIEFEIMMNDIESIKKTGVNGVVIGVLTPDGSVDTERCKKLIEKARPMEVTFHRAFDMAADPFKSLEDIIGLGIERLLTSGQQQTALQGNTLISELIEKAQNRIIIMPGSGINENNIAEMVQSTHAKEYHMSLRKTVDGKMLFRPNQLKLSAIVEPNEFSVSITDATRVKKVRDILTKFYK